MRKILIVGNPNAGKTTLFNALTGRAERVGNWHGVTVGAAEATAEIGGEKVAVVDLPGIYSLTPYSKEEQAAVSVIDGGCDLVVNVVEASVLGRSLTLTRELKEKNLRLVVAVNMTEELEKRGGKLDIPALSHIIGVPAVGFDGVVKAVSEQLNTLAAPSPNPAVQAPNHATTATTSANTTRAKGSGYELPRSVFTPPAPYSPKGFDRLLLSPVPAALMFLAVMAAVFYLTFGRFGPGKLAGAFLQECLTQRLAPAFRAFAQPYVGTFAARFVSEGIICGLGGVVGFLPQLTLLYFFLIMLEESGILSRAAFVFDAPLAAVGLGGKVLFPLLVGFGCTATAVMSSRTAENKTLQKRAISALFFISCSARMPIFTFILTAFFPESAFLAVTCFYLFGIAVGLIAAAVSSLADGGKDVPFAMEIPPLRLPKASTVLKQLKNYLKSFIIKIGSVLFAVSAAVWLLRSVSPTGRFLEESEISSSILALIGSKLAFLFAPMGAEGWQLPVAALVGLVAKEGVVSVLSLAYPAGIAGAMSPETALAFTAFAAYYTPCVMALAATRQEIGRNYAFYGVFSLLVGFAAGYAAYGIALLVGLGGLVKSVCALAVLFAIGAAFAKLYSIIKRKYGHDKICGSCGRQACQNNCLAGRNTLSHGEKTPSQQGRKGQRKTSKRGYTRLCGR